MTNGFRPPPSGVPMCQYPVISDGTKKFDKPRACKRAAQDESPYCGLHAWLAKKLPPFEIREGGFCIGCAMPGRSYILEGITIALCQRHARALERALREGR